MTAQILLKMRALSESMIETGREMQRATGTDEWCWKAHGTELQYAGAMVGQWCEELESEKNR
jgi:hypothetical protein